jgi:serine/threonine-protein kinase
LKLVTISPATSIPDVEDFSLADVDRPPPARRDPYLGCTIDGRYKVEELLGEGGMGVVYLCRHKIIGKKVAMKVLRADLARDQEATERFLNEAKAASAIGNSHIIDISDFGQLPDGSTYFVMEYLEGSPLARLVESGQPVPMQRILHVAQQLAHALAAAHRAGIVHRDLKPDNIFLVARGNEKDFVKILDFGIAKVSTSDGKITRAGMVFGTPHYMSPEQAAGAPVDHRCDIYSLGVILYELASGRVPFDSDNFMAILTQHMCKAPAPIRTVVADPHDIPPGLEAVVLKCLSKRPEQRYDSMEDLAMELDSIARGSVPKAVTEMMDRSGGFSVPAEYFEKRAHESARMAASIGRPRERSRFPLYAGIAGVGTAVAIVVAIFAKSTSSTASQAAPQGAPASTAAAQITQVAVAVQPFDAHIFRGTEDLGTPPVLVPVEAGSKVTIEVRRDGYRAEKLELDGSTTKRWVKLEAEGAAKTPAGATAAAKPSRPKPAPQRPEPKPEKPKPKPSLGGGEIVNPWE